MNRNDDYLHHLSYLPKIYELLKDRGAVPACCPHCRGKLGPAPATPLAGPPSASLPPSSPTPEDRSAPAQPPVLLPTAESLKIYRKQDVLELTNISIATYYRHIKRGILDPRKCAFTGRPYYFEEDLEEAIEYSRIHGYL